MELTNPNMVQEIEALVNSTMDVTVSHATKVKQLCNLLRDYPGELVVAALAEKAFSQESRIDALQKALTYASKRLQPSETES